MFRKKQETVDEQILEMDKLNALINAAEKEMLRLKKQYETVVESRNFTGIMLIDRNDELCILYEKANIQEEVHTSGTMSINKLEDEVRILGLECREVERSIHVTRKLLPTIPMLDENVALLQKELLEARRESEKLSLQLEDPENKGRWRRLDGKIPTSEELQAKMNQLDERLNDKKEQLLEKELILEEITSLSDRLRQQAGEGRADTLELAKKVNDYQNRIRAVTRKLMATISELSMYQVRAHAQQQALVPLPPFLVCLQLLLPLPAVDSCHSLVPPRFDLPPQATAIKLGAERDDLNEEAQDATARLERGEAPTAVSGCPSSSWLLVADASCCRHRLILPAPDRALPAFLLSAANPEPLALSVPSCRRRSGNGSGRNGNGSRCGGCRRRRWRPRRWPTRAATPSRRRPTRGPTPTSRSSSASPSPTATTTPSSRRSPAAPCATSAGRSQRRSLSRGSCRCGNVGNFRSTWNPDRCLIIRCCNIYMVHRLPKTLQP